LQDVIVNAAELNKGHVSMSEYNTIINRELVALSRKELQTFPTQDLSFPKTKGPYGELSFPRNESSTNFRSRELSFSGNESSLNFRSWALSFPENESSWEL